jgi:hypothetical protein
MATNGVNKTNLYPGGIVPQREHTEIEEELHETAHIDYDRVAIVANPSVAALYEDALVYETGSAITSSGALSAYSGAKTGRSPSDKRIVQEPSSENEVWWGPVNKSMSPEVSLIFFFLPFRVRVFLFGWRCHLGRGSNWICSSHDTRSWANAQTSARQLLSDGPERQKAVDAMSPCSANMDI